MSGATASHAPADAHVAIVERLRAECGEGAGSDGEPQLGDPEQHTAAAAGPSSDARRRRARPSSTPRRARSRPERSRRWRTAGRPSRPRARRRTWTPWPVAAIAAVSWTTPIASTAKPWADHRDAPCRPFAQQVQAGVQLVELRGGVDGAGRWRSRAATDAGHPDEPFEQRRPAPLRRRTRSPARRRAPRTRRSRCDLGHSEMSVRHTTTIATTEHDGEGPLPDDRDEHVGGDHDGPTGRPVRRAWAVIGARPASPPDLVIMFSEFAAVAGSSRSSGRWSSRQLAAPRRGTSPG